MITQSEQFIEEGTPDIRDYLLVLRRRAWVTIIFFIVTVITVTAGTFLITPVYKATVTLLIDVPSPELLSIRDDIAIGGSGYASYREYYQTQLEVIKSYSTAKQVFDEFKFAENPDYAAKEEPVKVFLKNLIVEPVRDTRLIKVNFLDKSPQLAADVANKVVSIYVDKNLSYITDSENVNLLKNEYLKLQSKYSEYSKIYKEKHPKMIRLKEEMSQMEQRAQNVSSDSLLTDAVRVNNIKIVDAAEVPVKPAKPNKKLNLALALLVGFFGGIGLAFFFEYMDNTIKDTEDVERYIKMPFLGIVPVIKIKDKEFNDTQRATVAHSDLQSTMTESYRAIRTSLLCASSEDKPIKTILVTSASPLEGKSTTAANLAIVLAQGGAKVLLVDADMRKPRLHTLVEIKSESGLSNFLSRHIDFQGIVNETKIENLYFVSSGSHPPNPAELLGSKKMKVFLDEAKNNFDRIIIDSPPIAAVTDAAILSGLADGTILVTHSHKTPRGIFPRVKQIFKDTGANVLGVIINNVVPDKSGYYYYNYYKRD